MRASQTRNLHPSHCAPNLRKCTPAQSKLAPLAEAIVQGQISQILAEVELTAAGQPVPDVLYHVTPLPKALMFQHATASNRLPTSPSKLN